MPQVSIVTPMFNAAEFIEHSINSVLAQTFLDWEMIIVDDFSTDLSVEIVRKFSHDPRVKLLTLSKNVGPAMARNKAIEISNGRYIAFLDSDDIWLPTKLEKQLADMKETDFGISFSAYYLIDKSGLRTGLRTIPKSVTYESLLRKNSIGNLTGIYDVWKFGKRFLKNIKHEDYAFWLDLFKSIQGGVRGINEPLAEYRVYSSSVSSNKLRAASWTWNIYRNIEQLPLLKALYYFCCYVFNSILDRLKRTKLV